jgi:uncharacterized protein
MIPTFQGELEAQIFESQEKNKLGIIICHPHPLYGGTMANNVVRTIFYNCGKSDYTTIRFNFRGVGKSKGNYSDGPGEVEDVKEICNFMLQEFNHIKKIIIIGYSFGAAIGCSIAGDFNEIIGYVAISYPFTFIPKYIANARISKPKLFIMGDQDDFTRMSAFDKEYEKMPEPKEKVIFSNMNHFWGGIQDDKLAETIYHWVLKIETEKL